MLHDTLSILKWYNIYPRARWGFPDISVIRLYFSGVVSTVVISSDIKEREFFLAVNKDYLRPIWFRFLSGMVFWIALWWFISGIVFWSVWHGFYSGFRNVGRCQLLVCTPKFCSGWIPDKGCCKLNGRNYTSAGALPQVWSGLLSVTTLGNDGTSTFQILDNRLG